MMLKLVSRRTETNMATVATEPVFSTLILHVGRAHNRFSDARFYELCQANRDLRLERNPQGDLIIMPPAGGESGLSNSEVTRQLGNWNAREKTGAVFDSSTGFSLPNGAIRAPDATWVRIDRWRSLTRAQRKKFPPLAPDFVIEIRSETDTLPPLRAKMREYMECGVRLGWLIDPLERRVEVFRPGKKPREIKNPSTLSGEPELAGFSLELEPIWSP